MNHPCQFRQVMDALQTTRTNKKRSTNTRLSFPNLEHFHVEGVDLSNFTTDSALDGVNLPLALYVGNEQVVQHTSSTTTTSTTTCDRMLHVHLTEHNIVTVWNHCSELGIYVNPFCPYDHDDGSIMDQVISSDSLSLIEKKNFIERVMSQPGEGPIQTEISRGHLSEVEVHCFLQWMIYCLNKNKCYKVLGDIHHNDFTIAKCLLYGWDPSRNLLELLMCMPNGLVEPVLKLFEKALQSNPSLVSLKRMQQAIFTLFQKKHCETGVQLIQFTRKYLPDGMNLFQPTHKNETTLLHYIVNQDFPMFIMKKILPLVTPEDLIHEITFGKDTLTVLTLALGCQHLSNEFLLEMIEKQKLLVHLPVYEMDDGAKSSEEENEMGRRSLLHFVASDVRRWELMTILVDTYGCDLNVRDLSGRTPRDVAILFLNHWQCLPSDLPSCLQ